MKIISWNVNGIRAALKKGLLSFLEDENPDILCLQEVKAFQNQVDLEIPYYQFWNSAERPGYSGVLTLVKESPISVHSGMNIPELDNEGRVLTVEYPGFYLVNVYTPNAKRDLSRLEWKQNQWNPVFENYLKTLNAKKPVIFCGDLNVAHKEIDLANPKSNTRNAGFTVEERRGFDQIIEKLDFVDTFRMFEKGAGHYTWWSNRPGVREKNIGWRIDYFCVTRDFIKNVKKSDILPKVMGSDHCPIRLTII